jgi:hypothetical protein
MVWVEGLGELKENAFTLSGLKPRAFLLVA